MKFYADLNSPWIFGWDGTSGVWLLPASGLRYEERVATWTLEEAKYYGWTKEIPDPRESVVEAKPLTIFPEIPRTESNYIRTYTGRKFWPLNPRVEDVDIRDIAHALSMKCRFGGMTNEFYSVAQHSVFVSNLVPPCYAFIALMHDAAEAYMADIATPVKKAVPLFQKMEERIWEAVRVKFQIPEGDLPEAVKKADHDALLMEAKRFVKNFIGAAESNGGMQTIPMAPKAAEMVFLNRFIDLAGAVDAVQYRAA